MARAERRGGAKASERLRRLLVVVPYLVRHPGAEISEVTRIFGIGEEDLVEDLDLLFMSGLPPYGPGDLIDVEIQEGRVWIRMADYFERPLRLTRSEAITLYLRGAELAAMPEAPEAPALDSALAKLEQTLGPETLGELPRRLEAAAAARSAEMLEVVRDAVRGQERLRIEYYATSSATKTVREIDAEEVFHGIGNWYVVAWDQRSGEERLFRADRIRSATPTGVRFAPRGLVGAGRSLYTPSDEDVAVRLLLQPDSRWVAEYYEITEATDRIDGALEVVLSTNRMEWLERLLLRLWGNVEVLAPAGLRDRVRDLARRTLEPYR